MLVRLLVFAILLWAAPGSSSIVADPDPCDNFYGFACAQWKAHDPNDAKLQFSRSIEMSEFNFGSQIEGLLSSIKEKDTETEIKVKKFYKSCLDEFTITYDEYKKKVINRIKDLGQWQEDKFDWQQMVAEISHQYGINIIFGYSIINDHHNHSAHQMLISSQDFRADYVKSATYKNMMVHQLKRILDLEQEEAETLAWDMMEFESILWEGHFKAQKNELVNVWTSVDEIHNKYYPDLDFKKFLATSYGKEYPEAVYVAVPKYLDSVVDAIKKTPKKVVAGYVRFQLLLNLISGYTYEGSVVPGFCTMETERYFPRIVSSMFYNANNLKEREQAVQQIFKDVRIAGKINLVAGKDRSFLAESYEYAYNKLDLMQLKIASYENHNFDEEYQQLSINDNYLDNKKSILAFKALKNRESLNKAPNFIDDALYLYHSSTSYETNTVIFPVFMLMSDFYWSPESTNAYNYGRLGYVLAREILNGISGQGCEPTNNVDFPKYWRERDQLLNTEFAARKSCFNQQYNGFKVEYENAFMSVFEQPPVYSYLSENGALFLAYETYKRWYDNSTLTKDELNLEMLPHSKYSPKQQFFTNYAQLMCSDMTEEMEQEFEGRLPKRYEINIPLWNYEEFAKEFNCPAGSSAMNPVKKCEMF